MCNQPGLVRYFILGLPGNREVSLFRPTRELTEDIDDILSLLSTAAHTGVYQDFIHDAKYNDGDDSTMSDINESESGSCTEK